MESMKGMKFIIKMRGVAGGPGRRLKKQNLGQILFFGLLGSNSFSLCTVVH
jgi:hypothetical protein